MQDNNKAYYSSYETFGAVDGPGTRLVIFLQGCPLKCKFCHNPETQDFSIKDKTISVQEIIDLFKRNKEFYSNGGITVSGGEPLSQIKFVINLFKKLKEIGIDTCVDTSGITFNEFSKPLFDELLKYTDTFLIDVKHMDSEKHKKLVGLPNENPLAFVKYLDKNKAGYWVRHVLVPGWTDEKEDLLNLGRFLGSLKHMKKFEILPYHNMMIPKYQQLNMKFELPDVEPPEKAHTRKCMAYIKEGIKQTAED